MQLGRAWGGTLLVVIASVCFGLMGLFRHWAVQEGGANTETVLFLRFAAGAVALGALAAARGARLPWGRGGRTFATLLVMGAVLYVGESFCYFKALEYIPSGLVALLLYTYPGLVGALAWVLFRERLSAVRTAALGAAVVGTALTVGTIHIGGRSGVAVGVALGLGSALTYAVYILAGSRLAKGADPLASAAIVCGAAAVVFAVLASGVGIRLPGSMLGWAGVAGLTVFSTVIALAALLAGLQRIGAVQTSTLSTIEALTTVVVGASFMGEHLTSIQIVGGVLILAAAVVMARTAPKP